MRDSFTMIGGDGATLASQAKGAQTMAMNLTNHEIEAVFSGAGKDRSEQWREAA